MLHSRDWLRCLQCTQVGQRYGIRFPRDFGLLVKQALYFDR